MKRVTQEWIDLFSKFKIDENTFSKEILKIPTFPAIANNNGIDELSVNSDINLSWNCCYSYKLKINQGSLISKVPKSPTRDLYFQYGNYIPTSSGIYNFKINPLGWLTNAPIIDQVDYGECFYHNDRKIFLPKAEPFHKVTSAECINIKEREVKGKFQINFLEFDVIREFSAGTIKIYETKLGTLINNKHTNLLLPDKSELTFKIPLYDVYYYLLYPFKFYRFHTNKKINIENNIFVIELDSNNLVGFISKYGLKAELMPGMLKVISNNPFYIVEGSPVKAFRVLIESITLFPYGNEIINHIRSGNASVMLTNINENMLEFEILNVSNLDSIVEIVPKIKTEKIEVCSYLGCYDIIESQGIYRIPAPSGCYCKAKIQFIQGSSIKNRLLKRI